jgi:predicted RecA/RadA family phage recombinase
MAALASPRNTKERVGDVFDFPVKAATTCHQGGLAVLDAGYAAPGRVATTLIAVGLFQESATAVSAGDAVARVKRGVFKLANSTAGDLIAQANVGADCYIVDDQTVALTNGGATRSRAGKIAAVDADGVWVQVGLGL